MHIYSYDAPSLRPSCIHPPSLQVMSACVPLPSSTTLTTGSSQWDYLSTGRGLLTFNLTNLRTDIAFYFFSNGLRNPAMR